MDGEFLRAMKNIDKNLCKRFVWKEIILDILGTSKKRR